MTNMIISTRSFSSSPHIITHIENRCQLICINHKYIKTWVWRDLQSDELMMNWVFFWDMISPTEKNFEVTCEKWMRESKTVF